MTADSKNLPVLKRLERNARGELVAWLNGSDTAVEKVSVARCFPWSALEEYISIRDKDGKELVLLGRLSDVDAPTAEIIRRELHDRFFVPRIRRVVDYQAEFDVVSITAETDRGEVTFQIRNRDDVRQLSPVRAVFRDVDGNIYEVDDYTTLDRASQRHLEPYF